MVALESITLIIASVGACISSVVYSFKHIKSSECWGSKCTQVVETVHITESTDL